MARFARTHGPFTAPDVAERFGEEVAFLVDDAFQGKGLGTLLLERLALIAAKRGVRRFQAFVLAENKQMLSVFMESGFRVRAHREGGEVVA